MQLQVKMLKMAEIRFLKANKQQRRYQLTYLDVSNIGQGYG